jgi:hypothetical protein
MIQYHIPGGGLGMAEAAACEHRTLSDLRRHGPWTVSSEQGAIILTQVVAGWQAAGWGDWMDALPGPDGSAVRRCRLAINPPDMALLRRPRLSRLPTVAIELDCGLMIRVPPALALGGAIEDDGSVRRPASPYAESLFRLVDRSERGEQVQDAEWRACIRLAIQTGHRLTSDAITALRLISESDVQDYLDAMLNGPKAQPADAG